MKTKITLTNPTDDELSAAVTEHIAGREWDEIAGKFWNYEADKEGGSFAPIPFATSADAVLPLLEQFGPYVSIEIVGTNWLVIISSYEGAAMEGMDRHLPRAACIALLRANGVEVIV